MTRPQVDVNFFTPEAIADPYPLYERIREAGGIVWNGLINAWMAIDYDLVSEITLDNQAFEIGNTTDICFWFDAENMMTVDGDYHRKLRMAFRPMFSRGVIASWEKRVAEVVDQMLEPLVTGRPSFDLIADFTMIPTVIVAEMLGVPEERHADFRRWSHDVVSNLSYGAESEERIAIMQRAAREVNAYLREEIERHRRELPDDMITAMLRLEGEERMTPEEIRSTAVLLLIAGYDTTAKTMSNALIALAANPAERALVAGDLSLVPAAIEEAMRWDGPVQFVTRNVMRDVSIGGQELKAGENVYTFYAAANRDPKRWADAARFDVRRERKTHMGFGHGPHLCLGAPLARLEVKIALERLLSIAPHYQLSDIDMGNAFFVRGPEAGVVTI